MWWPLNLWWELRWLWIITAESPNLELLHLNRTNSTSQEFIICSEKTFLAEECWIQLAFSFLEYNNFHSNKQKNPKIYHKTPQNTPSNPQQKKKAALSRKQCYFNSRNVPFPLFSFSSYPKEEIFLKYLQLANSALHLRLVEKKKIWFWYQLWSNYCCTLTLERILHCPHPSIGSMAFLDILK